MKKITAHQSCVMSLLAMFVLILTTPAGAVPIIGYLEGTAANGWQGDFAVRLSDGTTVSGVQQMVGGFTTLSTLPLTTTGCDFGPGCTLVTNVSTSTTSTMSFRGLALEGSSSLGSLGPVSWGAQIVRLLPGEPSPTAAVLAIANGTIGGTTLTRSSFSFGFNSTLTTFYSAVNGGQILSGLRLDFTDGIAPPTSGALREQAPRPDGTPGAALFINNGVPVALGTPLSGQSVPVPSTGPLMALSLAGLVGWHWRRMKRL
jgi:hypothetical protein